MPETIITNRRSVLENAKRYGIVALAVVAAWGGIGTISRGHKAIKYHQSVARVEKAINDKDGTLSLELLKNLGGALEPEDRLRLAREAESMIENFKENAKREEGYREAEQALAAADLDRAASLLESMKKSGRYEAAKLSSLENKLSESERRRQHFEGAGSEEGLRKLISVSSGPELMELAAKYIESYPTGPERPQVERILAGEKLAELVGKLKREDSIESTHQSLKGLNDVLEKSSGGRVPLKELVLSHVAANGYFEKKSAFDGGALINEGDCVQVRQTPSSLSLGLLPEYLNQRNATIPLSSVGKVVYMPEDKSYAIVKFNHIVNDAWKENTEDQWQLKGWWTDGRKNAAKYMYAELTRIDSVSNEMRAGFRTELERLSKYIDSLGGEHAPTTRAQ